MLLASGVALAGAVGLGLTVTPPPTPALVAEIDRVAERDPCVGSVDRWSSRYYAWEKPAWARDHNRWLAWFLTGPWLGSDTSKVDIRFYQGGDVEFYPPGRHLLRADQSNNGLMDDSNMQVVFATYDVRARRMIEWTCGPNIGP